MKTNDKILDIGNDNFIVVSDGFKKYTVNANIKAIQRSSDNAVFIAHPSLKQRCKTLSFYIIGFWYNDFSETYCVHGRYFKNDEYPSANICTIDKLIKEY